MKLLVLFFIISLLTYSNCFDCSQELGCQLKKKFYCFVSSSGTRGETKKLESTINFKNVYVFKDKIVFYKAKLPQENRAELEIPNLNRGMNEAYIERLIPFRHIILECGKFQTRICHSKDLPAITKSEEYKVIRKEIENADDKCVAFTYYDRAYKTEGEKTALICVTDTGQINELLAFKNFLSRSISEYHLEEANNRFDASEGIEIFKDHYITYKNNKPIQVKADVRGKSILLTTDDDKNEYVKSIQLIGLRNSGAYSIQRANELKKLKEGWADQLNFPPPQDCCIVLPSN